MNSILLEWQPHRLFPYERRLAAREVMALLGEEAEERTDGLRVPLNGHSPEIFQRFTYFSRARLPNGNSIQTDQWRLESFERARRAQSTRYSAHGLHEYKGKFNPQVVRALGNLLKLGPGAAVLDPFCGSGTTLLEGAHVGWNAVGIDLNPLAVFIANAKVTAVHATPRRLEKAADDLLADVATKTMCLSYDRSWSRAEIAQLVGEAWDERLPNVEYLSRWFTPSVLAQFLLLVDSIDRCIPASLRNIFLTVLSDLVRDGSLQDPGDLRIRRRKDALENYPVVEWFITATTQRVARVIAARSVLGDVRGHQIAMEADNREPLTDGIAGILPGTDGGSFDAAITSPPYATALPYIDTQRLSLCLLGLIDAASIAARDRALIGSREISTTERLEIEADLLAEQTLPDAVRMLCQELHRRADSGASGFRRRNVPALTYRYFRDMARTFQSVRSVLKPHAPFALVIGRNRTTLDGVEMLIDTPQLLAEIATASGFDVEELVELDTYQRFGVHQRNSIRSEWMLLLRRASS